MGMKILNQLINEHNFNSLQVFFQFQNHPKGFFGFVSRKNCKIREML